MIQLSFQNFTSFQCHLEETITKKCYIQSIKIIFSRNILHLVKEQLIFLAPRVIEYDYGFSRFCFLIINFQL